MTLEMEEVEGLINANKDTEVGAVIGSSNPSSRRRTAGGKLESAITAASASVSTTISSVFRVKHRCRVIFILTIAFLVLLFIAGRRGEQVKNVEDELIGGEVIEKEKHTINNASPQQQQHDLENIQQDLKSIQEALQFIQHDLNTSKENENEQSEKEQSGSNGKEGEEKLEIEDEGSKENDEKKGEAADEKKEEVTDEKKEEKKEEATDEKKEETNDQKEEITDRTEEGESVIDDDKWGHWKFYDGGEETRPKDDYCGKFRNRDIPAEKFPENSWQTDAVYVNHFLDEASNLVTRAQEAIYTEYGHGLPLSPDELKKRSEMFHLSMYNFTAGDNPPGGKRPTPDNGGWTTKKSFDGLVRRLLHAMMTNDSFTVILGGHSAAAGHGNHFLQSYMMQFHLLMEPIFNRLGMKLITRNISQGGLGTIQTALGSRDLYGDEVDVLLWDSSMTENWGNMYAVFALQALAGGNRAPALWSGIPGALKKINLATGADVGFLGSGMNGIPMTLDEQQAETLPWAARYIKCDPQRMDLCNKAEYRFRTTCWVERPDITPPKKQSAHAGSQVKWHPGFRVHQLTGRVLAFTILEALEDAISIWSEVTSAGGHPLPDKYWHVSEYYDAIQERVKDPNNSDVTDWCKDLDFLPTRVCRTGMHGRTEYTPRANPDQTGLLSILKPGPDGYLPQSDLKMVYEGPDVPNPSLQVPEGAFDIHAIINARRLETDSSLFTGTTSHDSMSGVATYIGSNSSNRHDSALSPHTNDDKRDLEEITLGLGWKFYDMPGHCDGTAYGICGRLPDSNCLLYGHHDSRGGILGDSLSGWLVMNLKDVKEGLIIIKVETWYDKNPATAGWKTVNNAGRFLGKSPEICENMGFEYAIDGKISTLDKTHVVEDIKVVERVVQLLTILDDEEMSKQGKERDVEVAIRLTGCDRQNAFKFTHIYWA